MSRVLIVDDEPDILLMLRVNLEADGFETALAADGETALKRLSDEPFDLVVLDVMMPLLDGWGVLDRMKEISGSPRVIVLSARTSAPDRRRALQAGAAAFIAKPFSPTQLSAMATRVLALSPSELEVERQAAIAAVVDA